MKKIIFIVVVGWAFASHAMDIKLIERHIKEKEYGLALLELPNIIGKKNTPLLLQLYLLQDLADKLPFGHKETCLKNKINALIASAPEKTRTVIDLLIETKIGTLREEVAAKNERLKELTETVDNQEVLLKKAHIDEIIENSYVILNED